MKKLQLSLCALGAYIVLVAAFGIAGSHSATGQGNSQATGKEVLVVNSASQPVPVIAQGNSSVEGTVGIDVAKNLVKAAQAGDWNVGINGTPTVRLPAETTVGIDPDRNAVRSALPTRIVRARVSDHEPYVNNTHRRVVIEQITGLSARTTLLQVKQPIFQVPDVQDIWIPPSAYPNDVDLIPGFLFATRIYIEPGESLNLAGLGAGSVWITGCVDE